MKSRISTIFMTCASLLASCSDGNPVDDATAPETVTITFAAPGYGDGVVRGRAASGANCWEDWNENTVLSYDLFLLKDGIVTAHHQDRDFTGINDCLTHTLVRFTELPLDGITPDAIRRADHVALVANYRPFLDGSPTGRKFTEIYRELQSLHHDQRQQGFVMVAYEEVPADMGLLSTLHLPLKRIAAKIRLTLTDASGAPLDPASFRSILCRYTDRARVLPDAALPTFTETIADPASLYTTTVPLKADGGNPGYPDDITDDHTLTRECGHVYYTYPTDWTDYSAITLGCTRWTVDGKTEHKGHGDRYEIAGYDDRAPADPAREMFLIAKAPFEGRDYYYKIPVNYRLSALNDRQCFTYDEMTTRILPLYRAERNTFYDVTARIDRPGAPTVAQAASLRFTVDIAPLAEGGSYHYIYN